MYPFTRVNNFIYTWNMVLVYLAPASNLDVLFMVQVLSRKTKFFTVESEIKIRCVIILKSCLNPLRMVSLENESYV